MSHNTLASTRLQALIVIWLTACGLVFWGPMTVDQWIDITKWAFGIYAASEGVAKSAQAYKEKT